MGPVKPSAVKFKDNILLFVAASQVTPDQRPTHGSGFNSQLLNLTFQDFAKLFRDNPCSTDVCARIEAALQTISVAVK